MLLLSTYAHITAVFPPSAGPCHPNPCHNNGECQLVPNRGDVFTDYICKCPAGYDGVHCQISEYRGVAGVSGVGGTLLLRTWGPPGQHRGDTQGVFAAVAALGTGLCREPWAGLDLAGLREGPRCVDTAVSEPRSASLEGHSASSNGTRGAWRLSLLHASSQPCCGCMSRCTRAAAVSGDMA